jgi:hypothetical protein
MNFLKNWKVRRIENVSGKVMGLKLFETNRAKIEVWQEEEQRKTSKLTARVFVIVLLFGWMKILKEKKNLVWLDFNYSEF